MLDQLIKVAKEFYSGHLTILKFTTNWRVEFETPYRDDCEEFFQSWPVGKTFEEAALAALNGHEDRAALCHEKVRMGIAA